MEPEINELLIKYFSGNASEKEQKEVEAWRKEGANEELFRQTESVWHLSVHGKENFSPDVNAAWKRFSKTVQKDNVVDIRKPNKYWYAVAAAAVLIPFVVYFSFFNNPTEPVVNVIAANEQQTADTNFASTIIINEVSTNDSILFFYLPDSSKVWLNKKSKFSFPEKFLAEERVVNLEGEAYFEIKPDALHPFIIYTENSVTRVKGTAFNLKAYPGQKVEITVVSGEVEFSSLDKPEETKIVLRAEDKALLAEGKEIKKSKTSVTERPVSWTKTEKSQKRFRKFLNRIKQLFKKQPKEKNQE